MGARKSVPKPDDASPGPVYSPRVITPGSTGPIGDAAQYSFGSSRRWEAGSSSQPGPGQYAQVSTRIGGSLMGDAAKYGFGTSSQRPSNDLKRGQRCVADDGAQLMLPWYVWRGGAIPHLPVSSFRSFISKEHATKANYAAHSPGPLMYDLKVRIIHMCMLSCSRTMQMCVTNCSCVFWQDGFGSQLSGTAGPNSPRYTMRPRLEGYQPSGGSTGGRDQPGPGQYNGAVAFGQQVHSARGTAASFSFGTSERHRPELNPKKTSYAGKDFERQNWGEAIAHADECQGSQAWL